MTQLKYVVASVVVLSAYLRLNDSEFIVRSFHHGRDGLASGRKIVVAQRPPMAAEESTKNKKDTGSYDVGQFCPFCTWNENSLCIDRAEFLVRKYGTDAEEARKSLMPLCTTPPIFPNSYADEEEPSVILHAGPHKTGTTAMQAFIYDLKWVNDTIFLRDNLRVPSYEELPGVFAKEGVGLNLPHCSVEKYKIDGGNMNIGMCDRMRKAFPLFVMDAYNKAQNILIVAEDLDRKEINFKRMRFFLQPYKKVKVVVTYRRLHDWLPSYYNQIMDHYLLVYAQGQEKFPSFVEWLPNNYDNFLQAHSIQVAERFRSYDIVESVDIYNMHDHRNLIDHFFCEHLHAEAVCQVIRDGAKPSKSNIGSAHEYERILIEASLGGRISVNFHKPVSLIRGVRLLARRVEEMNVTLPRICPPKTVLDEMLQTEIEQERAYFPEWYESQGGDAGLRKSFGIAVGKKFCSYDVDKIFEWGILDSVFREFH